MQINTIYTRSVLQTMAGKAIRDLRSGGQRELRNVMELCKGCAAPLGYQKFWSRLENILRRPDQQYGALLSRAANDVDINCLKTLIANLGLHAYTYGSQIPEDTRESGTMQACWMEPLDAAAEPDILHQTICDLQRRGTSSFLVRIGQKRELRTVLNIAGKHHQCVFFLIFQAASGCQEHLEEISALGNVIPLMECGDLSTVAGPLKRAGILFGFHRNYCKIQSFEAEEALLRQWIEAGCFLGVYEENSPESCEDDSLVYYTKLQEIRRKGTQEIFLIDLWRDRELVQDLLLQQQAAPECFRNKKTTENSS